MRLNNFSIGRLIGVHVSSIVNEVIRTILDLVIFLRKNFECIKTQIKPKQQTKQKQANKKQQR